MVEGRLLRLRIGIDEFELVAAIDGLAIDEGVGGFLPDRRLREINDEAAVFLLNIESAIEVGLRELGEAGTDDGRESDQACCLENLTVVHVPPETTLERDQA